VYIIVIEGFVFSILNELDRKIIQEMSKGVSSYKELAERCGVTRSTVYRRVVNLEKAKVIVSQLRVGLNFEKLNLVAVIIEINILPADEDGMIELLKKREDIKMIWRTYGAHNLVVIAGCGKGEEGKTIDRMRELFEKLNVKSYEISVGFSWEKIDMTPF